MDKILPFADFFYSFFLLLLPHSIQYLLVDPKFLCQVHWYVVDTAGPARLTNTITRQVWKQIFQMGCRSIFLSKLSKNVSICSFPN